MYVSMMVAVDTTNIPALTMNNKAVNIYTQDN